MIRGLSVGLVALVLMSMLVPVAVAQAVEVDMGILIEGDCDMNNTAINVLDLMIFRASYNGSSGYNPQADFDNNGGVNVFDLLIFRTNYNNYTGPVEV